MTRQPRKPRPPRIPRSQRTKKGWQSYEVPRHPKLVVPIAQIMKDPVEVIHVRVREYCRRLYLDARVFVPSLVAEDQWRPTPNGLFLRRELVRPVIEALERGLAALEALEQQGVLGSGPSANVEDGQ